VRWDARGEPVIALAEPDGSAEASYLAPEQWAGALVVHMIQGVPPPKGKDRTQPPPLAGVPEPLAGILRRALWPSIDLRFQTASELFTALAGAVAALR
jgi:hypothetical protein